MYTHKHGLTRNRRIHLPWSRIKPLVTGSRRKNTYKRTTLYHHCLYIYALHYILVIKTLLNLNRVYRCSEIKNNVYISFCFYRKMLIHYYKMVQILYGTMPLNYRLVKQNHKNLLITSGVIA